MDPPAPPTSTAPGSFPRTRGDGPCVAVVARPPTRFPPHSRGWTPRAAPGDGNPHVSPALAGMDLTEIPAGPQLRRFPRTRGDGPRNRHHAARRTRFPPHSRGWTLCRRPRAGNRAVSPALAGMDPFRAGPGARFPGFPRTRGDGPCSAPERRIVSWFPPHSRGWTRKSGPSPCSLTVSPALAGMDPCTTRSAVSRLRFPRTRGDGPLLGPDPEDPGVFPPHSRGWTVLDAVREAAHRVSPALAGMDHLLIVGSRTSAGFPRTRGDGPVTAIIIFASALFPPHSRGWTHPDDLRRHHRGVSPALAGMDPSPTPTPPCSSSFPRTRGDGPGSGTQCFPRWTFPPHSRGWTPRGVIGEPIERVSPALAGMDPA